jgi:hypothetical protein
MSTNNPTCPACHPANSSGQCGDRNCAHTYLGRHDGIGPAGPDQTGDDE